MSRGFESRSRARRRVLWSRVLLAGSLHARVAGVECIASTFHQPRSETSDESERARAELALPVPQAINPDRGWPGCAQAQAVASLSRFQKLASPGSLRSFSNGSCIFSGQCTNFVATIASVGKIFLMILAVEVSASLSSLPLHDGRLAMQHWLAAKTKGRRKLLQRPSCSY